MNNISKFDVHLLHEGKLYKVGLKEADKEDKVKFQVAGRTVTPFEYTPLPSNLKELFNSFNQMTLSSDELMKTLNKVSDVSCLSVTKKVYELGTSKLMQSQTTESQYGLSAKEKTYQVLRSCLSSDNTKISSIIHRSKLPDSTLFEVADKIEHDDRNVILAHAIREASRSFNLESSIEHICDKLTKHCIKAESATEMAAGIRKNFLNGNYERIFEADDFANAVTEDLQTISHNRHVFVESKPPSVSAEAETLTQPVNNDEERIKKLEASNFGFGKLHTPPKGTAYLDIRGFENPKELLNGKTLARDFAMATLKQIVDSKPEALIIDLRNHGGGSVYMSELVLSYFLEEGLPLTGFEYKVPPQGEELRSFPLDPCQTWSYEQLPKDQRLLDVPIYVLTSHDTFSAGEDIACHLKERGRATLIGETTGGGGDPNKLFDAKEFQVAMPVGFAKVPYGPSWEGVGVSPHIQIEEGQDAEIVAILHIAEKHPIRLLNHVLPPLTGPNLVGYSKFTLQVPDSESKGTNKEIGVEVITPTDKICDNKVLLEMRPYANGLGGKHPKFGEVQLTEQQIKTLHTHSFDLQDQELGLVGSLPIVIFSHGMGSDPTSYRPLLEELASHGYIVMNLNHPATSGNALHLKEGLSQEAFDLKMKKDEGSKMAQVVANNIGFVVDQIRTGKVAKLPRDCGFTNPIILAGHSSGGASSIMAARGKHQIEGCIDLDGALDGPEETISNGLSVPVLVILTDDHPQNEETKKRDKDLDLFLENNKATPKKISGVGHIDFTISPLLDFLVGEHSLERGLKTHKIASQEILDFMKNIPAK